MTVLAAIVALLAGLTAVAVASGTNALVVGGMLVFALLVGVQGVRTDCGWNATTRLVNDSHEHPYLVLFGHAFGILLGSTVTAALLWGIAYLVPSLPSTVLSVPLLVIGAFRLARPTSLLPGGWKVRRSWERWGSVPFITTFGVFLGAGFVTTVASPMFLVICAWAFVSGSFTGVLVVLAAFASGRILTAMLSAIGDASSGSNLGRTADAVQDRIQNAGYFEGLIAIALGIALFPFAGMS
ncbi:hypothetical protein [Luethyella okanaganae]|uniref:DUF92 domain-containing protein n=1 Tax=Luethyella okanaganae TaxID=69372 RepID=A0ABW1VGC9_9MICO